MRLQANRFGGFFDRAGPCDGPYHHMQGDPLIRSKCHAHHSIFPVRVTCRAHVASKRHKVRFDQIFILDRYQKFDELVAVKNAHLPL